MKKIACVIGVIALMGSISYFLTSCADKDTIAPLIFLKGGDTIVTLESPYVEPPAVAEDNADGTITGKLQIGWAKEFKKIAFNGYDSVTAKTGDWDINYYIIDKAGNEKTTKRVVTVRNWAYQFEANYEVKRIKAVASYDSIGNQYGVYPQRPLFVVKNAVTSDKLKNKKITFNSVCGDLKMKIVGTFLDNNFIKIDDQTISLTSATGVITQYRIWTDAAIAAESKILSFSSSHRAFQLKYYIKKLPDAPTVPTFTYIEIYTQI